jgi:hypothetical protein
MNRDQVPGLRIVIALDSTDSEPLFVLHPCRCDAPDPESTRMEPLEVPMAMLHDDGRALVVCLECDSHVLVLAAGREQES